MLHSLFAFQLLSLSLTILLGILVFELRQSRIQQRKLRFQLQRLKSLQQTRLAYRKQQDWEKRKALSQFRQPPSESQDWDLQKD